MKTTQKQRIINYIREFGSITSYEAYYKRYYLVDMTVRNMEHITRLN